MIISVTQPLEDALNQILQLNSAGNRMKMTRKLAGFMAKINRKRIKQNVTPDGHAMVARQRRRKYKNKKGVDKTDMKMFQKIGRQLRQKYEPDKAEIVFNGMMGNVALDHQLGRSGVSRDGQRFNDPMRELLGLSDDNQNTIAQMITTALVGFR
jgi:phage virion morphogenesis protein